MKIIHFAILCVFCITTHATAPSIVQNPISESAFTAPSPVFNPQHKSVLGATTLSMLCPGLGNAYLGDIKTATGLMGSFGTGLMLIQANKTDLAIRNNTYFYGVYAAYRDARAYNNQEGYLYKMPTDQLSDLAYAPFQWSILKKKEVWGGLLGALTLAVGVATLSQYNKANMRCDLAGSAKPLCALPVGIGEEAFFRGWLQSELSEYCTPWGGIALSSIAFGAAHIGNANGMSKEDQRNYYCYILPFITGFGGYFGYLAHKNNSLKESVALHTWYDFILFAAAASADHSASTGTPGFSISVPF